MDENDRELLHQIAKQIGEVMALIEKFKPMLERYEAASNAGSLLKARKVMRQ